MNWQDLEKAAPEAAAVGKKLLYAPDHGEVAMLATTGADGSPHLAPVCPIFTRTGIYLSIATNTPKVTDLARDGRYVLHGQVGADDEEFQIAGSARFVADSDEVRRVHDAITFPSYDPDHPVVELLIERVLWVTWPEPGRSVKRRLINDAD